MRRGPYPGEPRAIWQGILGSPEEAESTERGGGGGVGGEGGGGGGG